MTNAARTIGHRQPCFFIAEAGVNHNGSPDLAHKLIDVAVDAGADAVKFQTFRAEALVSPSARKAAYQQETTGDGNQLEMLRGLELPNGVWAELQSHCHERDVIFMSTPFDEQSCDLLCELGVDVIKLGSGDLTHRPLIEKVSLTGLPLILSTGMSNRKECEAALSWFRLAFRRGERAKPETRVRFEDGGRIALLHCVSSYPAPDHALNLRAIATMREYLGVPIGYSDHSEGTNAPLWAVAAGACIIEKHYTLDRSMEGPDHRASLEPAELNQLITELRDLEKVLGHGRKEPASVEDDVRHVARRSIVALRDLDPGELLTSEAIAVMRPAGGIAPAHFERVIGSELLVAVEAGTPLKEEHLKMRSRRVSEPQPPENQRE